jgi:endonuclease/exonuclease/phosphatase (EEP) superfamily protein YafD
MPFVMTGDFNAPIDAPELDPLREGLVDAFAAVDIPVGDDRRRSCGALSIDHVLARGFEVRACRIVAVAGDLSDHRPVVADLTPA